LLKRLFDFTAALAAVIVLSPVMIVTALLVRIYLGSPVLFRQVRPGLHGKTFGIFKFRSMRNANGPDGLPLSDAERLPPFGKRIRELSLDELPQLLNVIKGDMSLVGPRPLLVEYMPYYSAEQARRHHVRPGITGWAQINGRNSLSWEERFRLDVWYVDNSSFWLDLKILALTVIKIIKREGSNALETSDLPRFHLQQQAAMAAAEPAATSTSGGATS
jgi:lipopolysaccharide/colanic/teichoic acid biosynthesis glycosyltransferase